MGKSAGKRQQGRCTQGMGDVKSGGIMACRRPSRKFYIPGFVQVLVGRRHFPGKAGSYVVRYSCPECSTFLLVRESKTATFESELVRWPPVLAKPWGASPHSPASRVSLLQESTVARGQASRSFRSKPESRIVHLIKTLNEFFDKRAGFRVKPGMT